MWGTMETTIQDHAQWMQLVGGLCSITRASNKGKSQVSQECI